MIEQIKTPSSSNIEWYGYEKATKTLTIGFVAAPGKPPSVYDFKDVPDEVIDGFRGAASFGKYFSSHIKGKFESTKRAEVA